MLVYVQEKNLEQYTAAAGGDACVYTSMLGGHLQMPFTN